MLLYVDAMSRLKDILRKKELRKKALVENLSSIRKQLIDLGAIQLILFGSLAQDDVDVHSDLDLLAIMPGPRRGKEWIDEI
jgi:predicted nucleotidyltransferase